MEIIYVISILGTNIYTEDINDPEETTKARFMEIQIGMKVWII